MVNEEMIPHLPKDWLTSAASEQRCAVVKSIKLPG